MCVCVSACVCVSVCALLAPLLGCHSQAKLHDRISKIHFQIVFLLFLVPNSQAVESVCACVCVLIKGIEQVSTVSASQAQPSLALPQRLCILQQRDEGPQGSERPGERVKTGVCVCLCESLTVS